MGLTKTYSDGSTPVVAIIGAGFSGMCAAIRLQTELNLHTYQVFELEADIGGTWWSNTYPGCACDVPSHTYAFSFAPNYDWSRRYSPQPEIWAYQRRVAQQFDLYPKIKFQTEVTKIVWDHATQKWVLDYVHLPTGDKHVFVADLVFMGQGPLRIPQIPKQFEAFEGPKWHSAQWNHEYDLTGKRVAVVGSGASAIQIVPSIVDKVGKLEYYQRTATYLIPRNNYAYGRVWRWLFRHVPFVHFMYAKLNYWSSESLLAGFSTRFVHAIPRALLRCMAWLWRFRQVRDPVLRAKLTPTYPIGCRRIVVSSDYYPAVSRKNVSMHTGEIVSVKGNTLTLDDGSTQEVDALVLATGFKVQEMIPKGLITTKDGRDLTEIITMNPRTYYGVTVPETPNMFFLLGPQTGLGHNSVLFMIESQVDYAIKTISYMMKRHVQTVAVKRSACDEFMTEFDRRMKSMVWTASCRSWYQNEEGRVTALWWGTCSQYARRLNRFHDDKFDYVFRPSGAHVV